MQKKTLVITGGLGYIGSHTCLELLNDFNLVVIDNLSNASISVIDDMKKINKNITADNFTFYMIDLLDQQSLDNVFKKYTPYAVIHFAGYKSVSESIKNPGLYYNNNITATLTLLGVMEKYECHNLIFSSSATVYGRQVSPINEKASVGMGITNPYGKTKYMLESILQDFCTANKNLRVIALRYFNPIGAHSSGIIGENPNDIPNNLMPIILKVAINNNTTYYFGKKYDALPILGSDYETRDGTCERDFIHVVDLARAHVCAIKNIDSLTGFNVFNVGTGKPTSVLELVDTFKKVNKVALPYVMRNKRAGDIGSCYCDPSYIKSILKWKPEYSIEEMCRDAWNYQISKMKEIVR